MKNLFAWTCILLMFGYIQTSAQQSYTIAWVDGEFWYQPTGQVQWQKVENSNEKKSLNATDKVKIGKGAQVIIIAKDQSGFLLNKTGVWRVEQLIDKKEIQTPSKVQQYLGFLVKHLNHSEKSIDDYAEGYMQKRGAVTRGAIMGAPLMLSPQYGSLLAADTETFVWKSKKGTTAYTFALYDDINETENPIWQKKLTDTTLKVSLNAVLKKKDFLYYWCVSPTDVVNNVPRSVVKRAKTEDLKRIEQVLHDLQVGFQYNEAMKAFVKAALYEENQFYAEANRQFQQALKLEPQNHLFRKSYALFLARNGQLEEAKKYNED